MGKNVPDSIFTAKDAQDQIVDIVRAMVGFVSPPPPTLAILSFYAILIGI